LEYRHPSSIAKRRASARNGGLRLLLLKAMLVVLLQKMRMWAIQYPARRKRKADLVDYGSHSVEIVCVARNQYFQNIRGRASVARYGQPREKRGIRGEPAGYELSEEPHALRLTCLPLGQKPERSVHVQVSAWHPD
jgi:hypothetical protein